MRTTEQNYATGAKPRDWRWIIQACARVSAAPGGIGRQAAGAQAALAGGEQRGAALREGHLWRRSQRPNACGRVSMTGGAAVPRVQRIRAVRPERHSSANARSYAPLCRLTVTSYAPPGHSCVASAPAAVREAIAMLPSLRGTPCGDPATVELGWAEQEGAIRSQKLG
jgi:hypothetical protein